MYLRSMSHLRLCQHPHQTPMVPLRTVGEGTELNVAWISTRRDDKSCAQFCHFPARKAHSTPPQLKFVSAYSKKQPFEVGMSDQSVGGTSTDKRFLHHVSARSNALHNLDVLSVLFRYNRLDAYCAGNALILANAMQMTKNGRVHLAFPTHARNFVNCECESIVGLRFCFWDH